MVERSILVLEEIDVLLAERAELAAMGPQFRINGNESVSAVWFVYRTQEYEVRLSTATYILFSYLVEHRRVGQSASQIARGIQHSVLYREYRASNKRKKRKIRFHRTTIRMYVKRIRIALCRAFDSANVVLDPAAVLVSQTTDANEVAYKLRCRVSED